LKPDSSESEVKLTLEFPGGIAVHCRIDRIDRFGADCVIVDYKSSKTQSVKKLVHDGTKLQGPLYALAVREQKHLNPVAMIYWAVRDDEHHGWGEIPGYKAEFAPIPPIGPSRHGRARSSVCPAFSPEPSKRVPKTPTSAAGATSYMPAAWSSERW